MTKIKFNQETVKDFAESIAYHWTRHNCYPQVFIYENELFFDVNSPQFGTSSVLYNNRDECEIIFSRDDLYDAIEGTDIDINNLEDYEDEIINCTQIRLEQILEDYIIRTLETNRPIITGKIYTFGDLWDGSGGESEGLELVESGAIAIEGVVIDFELIEKTDNVLDYQVKIE